MTEHVMLVKTEAAANSNKFYELELVGSQVKARYGRVGTKGASVVVGYGGSEMLANQRRRKEAKGYQRVRNYAGRSANSDNLLDRALSQMARDDAANDLIRHLVQVNAHQIEAASGGCLTVSSTGAVTTELGPVTADAVAEARELLGWMQQHPSQGNLNEYLMLVPQRVPRKRGWAEDFFTTHTTFAAQAKFLDDLDSSTRFASTVAKADSAAAQSGSFRYALEQADEVPALTAAFNATRNAAHASTCRSVLRRTYRLVDQRRADAVVDTAARVGNVRAMWHGSRASNILSILAAGLVVPPSGAAHTTGRLFGDGAYFSEQSTKALNYGAGGVWSSGKDHRHFMFRADVAMGWEYRPNEHGHPNNWSSVTSGKKLIAGRRCDSINVKAGGGVRNHEAVVWNTDQAALAYLCEFTN